LNMAPTFNSFMSGNITGSPKNMQPLQVFNNLL
jgi:hypothetical protein